MRTMPRGGPDAAWWDRLYETDRLEHLDRPEAGEKARRVHEGLERMQRWTGLYRIMSRLVLADLPDVPAPRVLELGAGSGGLAQRVLRRHRGVRWHLSDVCVPTVRTWESGPLARHPRVETAVLDATSIDADDGTWDLAVFVFALHHLAPPAVQALLREGTRVASRLLIIDGWRHPVNLAVTVPTALLSGGLPLLHDAVISSRKFYSVSALRALAAACGEPVSVRTGVLPPALTVARARRVTNRAAAARSAGG